MSGDLEDWGEEDEEDLLAVAEAGEQVKKEEEEEDPFADGEDDLLMQSLLEVDEEEGEVEEKIEEKVETKVETKAKADEDSFEALKLEPPTAQQNNFLTSNFGHRGFKPLQWRIVRSVMVERRDQCVVMATGYGKSLTYQFQAVYQDRLTIVISPLISLMEDQVLGLQHNGISAAFLGSAQKDSAKVLRDLEQEKINVLYLTPEFITSQPEVITGRLGGGMEGVTCIAVDEAHCVSQWGHDFRSSYLQLKHLRRTFPGVPILALTATATPRVQASICEILELKNPQVTRTSFNRANLYLEVRPKSGSFWVDINSLLEKGKAGDQKRFPGATIIYCPTRKDVEQASEELERHGVENMKYHAGLGIDARKRAHKAFLHDEVAVVVATIAFGMGIDKPDVRRVVHWGAPRDMESYYQEIGRAGRDGAPASCRIYYSPADFNVHRHHLNSCTSEELRAHRAEMITKMEVYLGYRDKCRRSELLRHFDPGSTAASLGLARARDCCDCCTGHLLKGGKVGGSLEQSEEDKEGDFGALGRLLLEAVELMGEKRGLGISIKLVRGANDKNMWDKHKASQVFGAGKARSEKFWQALARQLVSKGLVREVTQSFEQNGRQRGYTGMAVSKEGRAFLSSEKPLLLPQSGELVLVREKPKAAVVVPRFGAEQLPEDADRTELYRRLVALRRAVAEREDVAPYMVVQEQTLLQLAATRPSSLASLAKVSGFTEAKVERYGRDFVAEVASFLAGRPGLAADDFPSEAAAGEELLALGLNTTTVTSFNMFREEGDAARVAARRGLAESTVMGHLATCLEKGAEVAVEKLGVTPSVVREVARVLYTPPISSHVARLGPVKEELDSQLGKDQVGWSVLRLVVAQLRREHGCSEEGVLAWGEEDFRRYCGNRRPGAAASSTPCSSDSHTATTSTSSATSGILTPVTTNTSTAPRPVVTAVLASGGVTKVEVKEEEGSSGVVKVEGQKRQLPGWMGDPALKKEAMAKKMKTNSLFK